MKQLQSSGQGREDSSGGEQAGEGTGSRDANKHWIGPAVGNAGRAHGATSTSASVSCRQTGTVERRKTPPDPAGACWYLRTHTKTRGHVGSPAAIGEWWHLQQWSPLKETRRNLQSLL